MATLPVDANYRPALGVYTPGVGMAALQGGAQTTDTSLVTYAAQVTTPGLQNAAGTLDAQRGNLDLGALITAAGATTTQTTPDQTNVNGRGVKVTLVTTVIGTGSVTVSIQYKDTASGTYITLLAGAAVITNTTNVYTVYPGLPATANISANDVLPRTWRVLVTANNANPATYTVGAQVIV